MALAARWNRVEIAAELLKTLDQGTAGDARSKKHGNVSDFLRALCYGSYETAVLMMKHLALSAVTMDSWCNLVQTRRGQPSFDPSGVCVQQSGCLPPMLSGRAMRLLLREVPLFASQMPSLVSSCMFLRT